MTSSDAARLPTRCHTRNRSSAVWLHSMISAQRGDASSTNVKCSSAESTWNRPTPSRPTGGPPAAEYASSVTRVNATPNDGRYLKSSRRCATAALSKSKTPTSAPGRNRPPCCAFGCHQARSPGRRAAPQTSPIDEQPRGKTRQPYCCFTHLWISRYVAGERMERGYHLRHAHSFWTPCTTFR
jgi:hypothetical protein